MKTDITQLPKELERRNHYPVFVVAGEELLLQDRSIKMIKDWISKNSKAEPQTIKISAPEAKLASVLQHLRSYSIFGDMTLLHLTQAEKLTKDMLDGLSQYLDDPSPNSILIVQGTKLDGRSRFAQAAAKIGVSVDCKPLYQNKIPSWISLEVKNHQKIISSDAARYLAEIVGNSLNQLSQAIEKLSYYVGNSHMIELKDVEKVVAEVAQRSIFELTDAIGNRNWVSSMRLLQNLIDNNQFPLMILSMIARHFRILIKAKEIELRRIPADEAAKYLGVHHFFAGNYLSQSKNFSSEELKRSFNTISVADKMLKSSKIDSVNILAQTLRKLCYKAM